MTFGDAAEKLINDSILDFVAVPEGSVTRGVHSDRKRKQVKMPRKTHAALHLLARGEHDMTIGDVAALLIGVSLMEYYGLDEDAETRQTRSRREKQSMRTAAAVERAKRRERRDKLRALQETVRRQLGLTGSGPANT